MLSNLLSIMVMSDYINLCTLLLLQISNSGHHKRYDSWVRPEKDGILFKPLAKALFQARRVTVVIMVGICEPVFRNLLCHSYTWYLRKKKKKKSIHTLPFDFIPIYIESTCTFRCLHTCLQIKHAIVFHKLNADIPSGFIYPYHLDESILW